MRRVLSLGRKCGGQELFIAGLNVAQLQVSLGPELMLGESLPTLVDRAQAGNGRGRDAEHMGGMTQQIAR